MSDWGNTGDGDKDIPEHWEPAIARMHELDAVQINRADVKRLFFILLNYQPGHEGASLRPMHKDAATIGLQVLESFRNCDHDFFDEIARVAKFYIRDGELHKGKGDLTASVIELAFDLGIELRRDPTKEEVKEAFAERGEYPVHDWTDMWKKAKLTFLKGNRGRPQGKAERK